MSIVLQDADLDQLPMMSIALRTLEAVFRARAAGEFVSPPRHHVTFPGRGDLVFTVGGTMGPDPLAGFRVYDTFDGPDHRQLVAVWSAATAKLEGVILGSRLGEIRTGAIGGIAIRYMSAPGAEIVGLIGTGQQARTQLEAAASVRSLKLVRVYGRDEQRRGAFAAEMEALLGIAISAVSSAREAVADADIILCATTSSSPVIDARWLKPGAHINTVGPKSMGAHELGTDVADLAQIIATDSPEQILGYSTPFFLTGTPSGERVVDLAAIVAGAIVARPTGSETTLFCSTGLAGTETLIGGAAIAEYSRRGRPG